MRWIRKLLSDITGKYDVMAYARREKREEDLGCEWYAFLPSEIYPATLARIYQARNEDEAPEELIDPKSPLPKGIAEYYQNRARSFSDEAFELNTEEREALLELARLWFTQALHVRVERPIGVHILKDDAYKLR
jgi:hypothetical protein